MFFGLIWGQRKPQKDNEIEKQLSKIQEYEKALELQRQEFERQLQKMSQSQNRMRGAQNE